MLTTNDEEVYRRAKALSWCGIDKSTFDRSKDTYSWDYNIQEVGLKANMNDITAAIGLAQLEELEERNKYRAQVAEWYDTYLTDAVKRPFESSTWHMYVIQVPERDKLYDLLGENGISAGVHYKPLYKYPIFPQTELLVTEKVFKEIITLPMHLELTQADVYGVCQVVNQHVDNCSK